MSGQEIETYVNTQSAWEGHPDRWYQGGIELPGDVVTKSLYPEPGDCRRIWTLLDIDVERDIKRKKILDICCNTGFYAMKSRELGASRVHGFDIQAKSIEAARKFAKWKGLRRCKFWLTGIDKWGWRSRYDTVFFLQTLYHFEEPEKWLALALKACRGLIVLIVKDEEPWGGLSLAARLRSVGFEQEARYPDPLAGGKVIVKARRRKKWKLWS